MQTLELMRGDNPAVSTDGVVVFGTRLLDEEVFEVRNGCSTKIAQLGEVKVFLRQDTTESKI